MGPNVKRLIIRKASFDAVPPGGKGIADAIGFLSSPERMKDGFRTATTWVEMAIKAVREAVDPNPWRNSTNEDIASEILRQMGVKKQG